MLTTPTTTGWWESHNASLHQTQSASVRLLTMASKALEKWETDRVEALDRMEKVHAAVTGGLRGRPRDVTELNHSLFLRLAGEVQGFCRDLHDESVDAICTPIQVPHEDFRKAFRLGLMNDRKLDTGNAGAGNIGNDWTKLGMSVWAELYLLYPSTVKGGRDWNNRLEWLNHARNGIAHNDAIKIADAHSQHPLTLSTFRVMRRRFGKFATGMDFQLSSPRYLAKHPRSAPSQLI